MSAVTSLWDAGQIPAWPALAVPPPPPKPRAFLPAYVGRVVFVATVASYMIVPGIGAVPYALRTLFLGSVFIPRLYGCNKVTQLQVYEHQEAIRRMSLDMPSPDDVIVGSHDEMEAAAEWFRSGRLSRLSTVVVRGEFGRAVGETYDRLYEITRLKNMQRSANVIDVAEIVFDLAHGMKTTYEAVMKALRLAFRNYQGKLHPAATDSRFTNKASAKLVFEFAANGMHVEEYINGDLRLRWIDME